MQYFSLFPCSVCPHTATWVSVAQCFSEPLGIDHGAYGLSYQDFENETALYMY